MTSSSSGSKHSSPSRERRRAKRLAEAEVLAAAGTVAAPVVQASLADRGASRPAPATAQRPARPTNKNLPGLDVRALAVRLIAAVTEQGHSLDQTLARVGLAGRPRAGEMARELGHGHGTASDLEARDRGLARLIAATVLRRKGQLDAVIGTFLEKPLPSDRGSLSAILQAGAAQLLFLDIAPHAVINIAVEQCRHDAAANRFARLTNAVLRRVSERGAEVLAALQAEDASERRNIPDWMWTRWVAAYGEDTAGRIASASLREAALDITVGSNPAAWASLLGGLVLPTGSVRLLPHVRVDQLAGFDQGAWWVQDAAAALPARLLGDVGGLAIADLCAAPGGKTAQLVAAGARVTAVDSSEARLERLRGNLRRLGLEAVLVRADATTWRPETGTSAPERLFDAVLLDVPCTATGTIRRHPDIPHLKRAGDIAQLAAIQARLLDHAFTLVRPGGQLVYCTCSLEPEEGPGQIRAFLQRQPGATRRAITAPEIGGDASWITAEGDLRTLPFHLPHADPLLAGMDGFFAARLARAD